MKRLLHVFHVFVLPDKTGETLARAAQTSYPMVVSDTAEIRKVARYDT